MTINVKLNFSNHLVWKAQVLPYFKSQEVFGCLDGTIPPPPPELVVSSPTNNIVTTTHNPLYNQWLR